MPTPTAPPGPPPAHYRAPGTRPEERDPTAPFASPRSPEPRSSGISPASAAVAIVVALLVGLSAGFLLGRATADDADPRIAAGPTTTTSPTTTPPGDTIPQSPPTTASPGTELAPSAIGTYEDPIPLGQGYVLGLYEIEVVDVALNATDVLAEMEPSNPPPDPGRRHVLVTVAVRCTDSSGPGCQGSIPFFVTDGTSEWHSFSHECGFVSADLGEWHVVRGGEDFVGHACFTVADDAGELVLGTEGFSGPVYFALER